MSYQTTLYGPTGWGYTFNSWNYGNNCAQIFSNDTIHFENDIFCAGIPTYVDYDNQQVTGYVDHYTIQVNYAKSGGCSALLSYNSSTG